MIGTTLARYTIESKLGEGGMGVVFKARDPQLGRIVAIKVLPPDAVADPDRKRRFVQEAKAASALNHPHIVTIYDIGAHGGTDFIVMEYLAGKTLDRLVPAQGLPSADALPLAIAIADALAAAHAAGIVHRDLKPANVIVGDTGSLKVLDFGVAKLLEPADGSATTRTVAATEAGTTIGTPAYMSPEQAEGRPVDARSDIFSFGSLLYQMLTGRQAFSGASRLSVLAKILNEEPAPPSRLATTMPPDLERLILRCLRKDPARRYQTMADLKVALEDVAEDSTRVVAPPAPLARRPSSSWWRWTAAALVLVTGVGIVLYLRGRTSPTPESNEPLEAVPMTSLPGEVRFPALSPNGDHIAFAWTGPTQDNNDIYVQQVGVGNPLRLTTDPANDTNPVWSPDGRSIAFLRSQQGSARHELRLVPPLGGAERKVAEVQPRNPIYRPLTLAWCPDGSCLIASDAQGEGQADALFTIALDSADKRQLTFPPKGGVTDADAAVSPDGGWLVFRRDVTPATSELHRLPLSPTVTPAGEPTRLTDQKFNASRPAWLPDSREIVVAARGSLWRLDAVAGGSPTRLPFVGQDGQSPTVARTGSDGGVRLVYRRVFSDSNVWRADTSAAGRPAASPPRRVIASTRTDMLPTLSPDGTRVAFFSSRSGEFELWVGNPDGSNAVQLTSLNAAPGFARWAPDGQTLAFHSDPEGHPDVLTVPASGGRPRVLTTGPIAGGYPSYSRDGRYIYFTGPDATGQFRVLKIPASGGSPVAVSQATAVLPIESYDGASVFYLEAAERPSALWRQPVAGGAPTKLIDGVVSGTVRCRRERNLLPAAHGRRLECPQLGAARRRAATAILRLCQRAIDDRDQRPRPDGRGAQCVARWPDDLLRARRLIGRRADAGRALPVAVSTGLRDAVPRSTPHLSLSTVGYRLSAWKSAPPGRPWTTVFRGASGWPLGTFQT